MNEFSLSLPQPPALIGNSSIHCYALIDCAQMDEGFYPAVRQNRSITSQSLFIHTPHAPSAVAGPLLVKLGLEKNEAFIRDIQEIEAQKPAVVWLWSEKDFKPLSADLKKLLFGETESGKKMFFRYFDPRCLEELLGVFKESESANKILAEIAAWAYKKDEQYRYLR